MDHVIRVMMAPSIITKDVPRHEPEASVQGNRQPICPCVEGWGQVGLLGLHRKDVHPPEGLANNATKRPLCLKRHRFDRTLINEVSPQVYHT